MRKGQLVNPYIQRLQGRRDSTRGSGPCSVLGWEGLSWRWVLLVPFEISKSCHIRMSFVAFFEEITGIMFMFKDGNPLNLHFVMFIPTLAGQGTMEQVLKWSCKCTGIYDIWKTWIVLKTIQNWYCTFLWEGFVILWVVRSFCGAILHLFNRYNILSCAL